MDWIDIGLYISYVMVIATTGVAILGGLIYTLRNIKDSIMGFAGITALALIFIISWAFSTGEVSFTLKETFDASTIKLIDGGLYTFYILLALAVLAVLYSNVTSLINRN